MGRAHMQELQVMNSSQAISQTELIDAINTAGVVALINQKFIEHANDETKAQLITEILNDIKLYLMPINNEMH